jgi:hypothetical protein
LVEEGKPVCYRSDEGQQDNKEDVNKGVELEIIEYDLVLSRQIVMLVLIFWVERIVRLWKTSCWHSSEKPLNN